MRQNDTGAWDLSNCVGECLAHAEETVGCGLGWLSWVADHKLDPGTAAEVYMRVYAHISLGSLGAPPTASPSIRQLFAARKTAAKSPHADPEGCCCAQAGRRRGWLKLA